MSKELKDRVQKAIHKHAEKQLKKEKGPSRTNEKPEKLVEEICLAWMRSMGWDVDIYESKSSYDPDRDRYISQSMKAGTADCMGHIPDGHGAIVEFKAKGKLATFAHPKNIRQQEFIDRKIKIGAFACVVDSVDRLTEIYVQWSRLKEHSFGAAQKYLESMVPRRTVDQTQDDLFPEA